MKIKIIGKLNDMDKFEDELNKYVNDGYKIIASNITADTKTEYIYLRRETSARNSDPDIYFYAVLQKD